MKNLAIKMAEDDLYEMADIMGMSKSRMDHFQTKRFTQMVLTVIIGIFAVIFIHKYVGAGIIFFGVFSYKNFYKSYKKRYQHFLFVREFEFNSLMKMVIPYLKQNDGSPLSTIFNKCKVRMNDGVVRDNMDILLLDMINEPQSVEPFRKFAYNSSGTDDADLIMTTIYDFQQNTADATVIDGLGKLITEKMMQSIDLIVYIKISRFGMFPTVVTMLPMLLIFGYVAGIMIYELSNFTGGKF